MAWDKTNQDEYNHNYYKLHKEEILKNSAIYNKEHKEEINASIRKRYANNPEPFKNNTKKYVKNNKEKQPVRLKKWRASNPDKYKIQKQKYNNTPQRKYIEYKRRADKKKQEIMPYEQFVEFWNKSCYYCGGDIKTIGIDRIDSKAGYISGNVVACCDKCNRSKYTYTVKDFISHCYKIVEYQNKIRIKN